MREGRRSRSAAVAATVAVLMLVAACSSAPESPPTTSSTPAPSTSSAGSSPTVSPSSSAPTPSGSASPSLTGAATTPVVRPPGDGGFGYLTDVRLASHPGHQRFVLQFDELVPGYEVRYVDGPVIADPSGETVRVAGDHVLAIRLVPSSGYDMRSDPAGPSYTGPTRIPSGTTPVREAVQTGDFEGVLQWVLGVDGEQPFVVTELANPPRLVVDVAVP